VFDQISVVGASREHLGQHCVLNRGTSQNKHPVGARDNDQFTTQGVDLFLWGAWFPAFSGYTPDHRRILSMEAMSCGSVGERFRGGCQHSDDRLLNGCHLLHDPGCVHVGTNGVEGDTRFRAPHFGL